MRKLTMCALAAAVLAGCAQQGAPEVAPADPTLPAGATPQAMARLRTPDGKPAGQVALTETAEGVHLRVEATGLTPGVHGFHIHAHGACEPGPDAVTGQVVPFGAAGGHFDPGHTRNHGRPGDPKEAAHAGELPNLTAGADGTAQRQYRNTQVTLAPGKTSVMGRTLVVHADADDYDTDPAGNSGARVLCGVIEPAQAGHVVSRTLFEGSQVYPEGIAIDAATGDAYVGSSAEGHLYRFKPGAPAAELFQRGGSPGRQGAQGLKVDDQRRLWIAGGLHGTVTLVDLAQATTVATAKVPPGQQPFVNDLVIAGPHVYVTDSYRPVVYRIVRGTLPVVLEPWLDLNTTPVRYVANQVNLNGIVASPDGRWLLTVQSTTGQLWRIDTATRAVTEVPVTGGSLQAGDGLVLRGAQELYVVRNAENEIVRLDLAANGTSARVTQRLHDPRFKYPTTAAAVPEGLAVVNGQLDKRKDPPPLLPFDVVTVGWPK